MVRKVGDEDSRTLVTPWLSSMSSWNCINIQVLPEERDSSHSTCTVDNIHHKNTPTTPANNHRQALSCKFYN